MRGIFFALAIFMVPVTALAQGQPDEFSLIQTQAQSGDTRAQAILGMMYETGRGTTVDLTEAAKWYKLGADDHVTTGGLLSFSNDKLGDPLAQFNLGKLYFGGRGVPKNEAEARKWFSKAANQGHSEARCILAEMNARGWGGSEDKAAATAIFRSLAEKGDGCGQNGLGESYELGWDGNVNLRESYAWYNLAAAQNYMLSRVSRDRVGQALSAEEVKRAQALSLHYSKTFSASSEERD